MSALPAISLAQRNHIRLELGHNFHWGQEGHVPPLTFQNPVCVPPTFTIGYHYFLTASRHRHGGPGHRQPASVDTRASVPKHCMYTLKLAH